MSEPPPLLQGERQIGSGSGPRKECGAKLCPFRRDFRSRQLLQLRDHDIDLGRSRLLQRSGGMMEVLHDVPGCLEIIPGERRTSRA